MKPSTLARRCAVRSCTVFAIAVALVVAVLAWSPRQASAQANASASKRAPSPSKAADAGVRLSANWRAQAWASYRAIGVGMTRIPVDETGKLLDENGWLEQRLRLMTRFLYKGRTLRIEVGGDLLSGLVVGERSSVGEQWLREPANAGNAHRYFEPRRLMIAWRTPVGELRLGHQVNNWGYGILSNSGERRLDFGNMRLGDLVERALFATRPLPNFYVAAGVDLVYRDVNASLLDGDTAINIVAAVFYRTESTFAGFFGTFRNQWDRDDDRLQVGAFDAHVRRRGKLAGGAVTYDIGAEAVLLVGKTTRLRPEPDLEAARVLAGLGVLRARLYHVASKLGLTFEAGFASGDNDRNDDTVRHATMHPDYRVGMILFPELFAGLTARAADRLADPTHVSRAPHGSQWVPSRGGVQNALYFWPRLSLSPLSGLRLRFGVLYAVALADVADPYWTNTQTGGANRNFYGGIARRRSLGVEIQSSATYRVALTRTLALSFAIEWGHLFPGAAFDDARAQPLGDVDRVNGRMLLTWRYR